MICNVLFLHIILYGVILHQCRTSSHPINSTSTVTPNHAKSCVFQFSDVAGNLQRGSRNIHVDFNRDFLEKLKHADVQPGNTLRTIIFVLPTAIFSTSLGQMIIVLYIDVKIVNDNYTSLRFFTFKHTAKGIITIFEQKKKN